MRTILPITAGASSLVRLESTFVGICDVADNLESLGHKLTIFLRRSVAGCVIGYIHITRMVAESEVAAAGATLQFFKVLGIVNGSSFSTLMYTGIARSHGVAKGHLFDSENRNQLLLGLRGSFWLWAAFCFTCTLITGS